MVALDRLSVYHHIPTVGLSRRDRAQLAEERVNKRVDQGRATREHVVAVATRLFAERGYEATSIEAVLEESGVSRGSLYHHFASKEALFEAAFAAVEISIGAETVTAISGTTDATAALRAGCLAWIRLAGDPVVQRIVLIDAPAVLGWERWREIEEQNALGLLKAAMQAEAEEGRVRPELVDVFAHMLLATMNELALLIARADDQAAAQQIAIVAVDEFLGRLLGT
jgi:AcrR family transcriptional regulator